MTLGQLIKEERVLHMTLYHHLPHFMIDIIITINVMDITVFITTIIIHLIPLIRIKIILLLFNHH
jgi:hypothetical protein